MVPKVFILLMVCCLAASVHAAEESSSEHNFVDVWFDPAKAAVGQHMTLNIMIGVDSYFSGTTDLALPDIEHALVVHDQPAVNGNKERDGTSFTTQTHQVDVYPDHEGILVVPSFQVTFTQSLEVNGELTSQPVQVATDQFLGLVTVPPAMQGLSGFMVSEDVEITDDWGGTHEGEYKVGAVLTRVVTISATDMASMIMPQFTPLAPRGVSVTLAEPGLSSNSRREKMAAKMVQHISYAVEAPGQYTLGGEILSWWDPATSSRKDHKLAVQSVDAGGLPWRSITLAAVALVFLILLLLALHYYLRRRDAVDLAIRQQLHSDDAGKRLAALYAYADYHQPEGENPVRLRTLLTSSKALVDKVLASRFSSTAKDGEPSRTESKSLYREIRKRY